VNKSDYNFSGKSKIGGLKSIRDQHEEPVYRNKMRSVSQLTQNMNSDMEMALEAGQPSKKETKLDYYHIDGQFKDLVGLQ
jgi:hypothetical protein